MPKRGGYATQCDNQAAKFRKRYDFSYSEPLNPFVIADSLGMRVVEPNDISGLSQEDLAIIQSLGSDWSGLSFSLPDKHTIIILNPFHGQARKNITLMEEICHFLYGHKPKTTVQLSGSQEINFLDYTKKDEKEAYWVGAAILIPFKELKRLISKHKTIEEIALHFGVSTELINFRLNVTGLKDLFKAMEKVKKLLDSY